MVTFLSEPNIERIQMLIYAGKRVRNRSQIPLRAYRACAFALFRILLRDGYFIPQKFDYGLRPSLRMTLGVAVRFAQDDTRGGGTLRSG